MNPDAEKVLREFLKALRVSISNAAIYAEGHTVFLRSLEDLKKKAESALSVFNVLELLIGPRHLIVLDKKLEKDVLYEDLARFFHRRNIKSVKISGGIAVEELNYFLGNAAKRPGDILKEGGIDTILKSKGIVHLSVEMLDYSQILKSGKEDNDIWAYLLNKAVDSENFNEIETIIGYFEQMITQVGVHGLLQNEDLRKNIIKFLSYVKEKRNDQYFHCVTQFFKGLLREKEAFQSISAQEDLMVFIKSLKLNYLADILLEELLKNDPLNELIFEIYDQFINREGHETIALSLLDKIQNRVSPKITLDWLNKTITFLAESKNEVVKEVYYPVFLSGLNNLSDNLNFYFDRDLLPLNYRKTILNLLAQEQVKDRFDLIADKVFEEVEKMPEADELEYCKLILDISQRRENNPALDLCWAKIDHYTTKYAENFILEGRASPDTEYFADTLRKSALTPARYIDEIFHEEKISPLILRSFFKFFTNENSLYFEHLARKLSNLRFLLKLIKNLDLLPAPLSLEILKRIYACPNVYVKIEALKMMQTLPVGDSGFSLSVLTGKTNSQVKEIALRSLMKDQAAALKAVDVLLGDDTNPLADAILEENIRLIERVNLIQAKDRLMALRNKLPWWKKNIKNEIVKVLEQWSDGKR